MSKKIIAVALALVVIVTCFVACGKKEYNTTKINGKEFVLATNNEGETIINEQNKIAVAVTDANGELVTNKDDKEPQTNWVQLHGFVTGKDFVQDTNYRLNSIEGWSPAALGKITKDNTDGKCFIVVGEFEDLLKEQTFIDYINSLDKTQKDVKEAFESAGVVYTCEKGEKEITNQKLRSVSYVQKATKDGVVVFYSESYYFPVKDLVYKLEYTSLNGMGYDESFNFAEYLETNFILRHEATK